MTYITNNLKSCSSMAYVWLRIRVLVVSIGFLGSNIQPRQWVRPCCPQLPWLLLWRRISVDRTDMVQSYDTAVVGWDFILTGYGDSKDSASLQRCAGIRSELSEIRWWTKPNRCHRKIYEHKHVYISTCQTKHDQIFARDESMILDLESKLN